MPIQQFIQNRWLVTAVFRMVLAWVYGAKNCQASGLDMADMAMGIMAWINHPSPLRAFLLLNTTKSEMGKARLQTFPSGLKRKIKSDIW